MQSSRECGVISLSERGWASADAKGRSMQRTGVCVCVCVCVFMVTHCSVSFCT